eukprot:gb/GECG01012997.1/.p1 GENE.gb/GECG01012997.1/~~gb/GECG01012997.1/.p1  ORF type:complete len:419 (+),score=64.59 gb/GECG01012997.1/:1-1257(+)
MAAAAVNSNIPSDNNDGGHNSPKSRRHASSESSGSPNATNTTADDAQRRNAGSEDHTQTSMLSSLWNSIFSSNGGSPLHPEAEARQFRQMMNTQYGRNCPEFLETSYKNALTQARDNFQILVVYLHSSEHQDTEEFCRNTLCTEAVRNVLEQENCAIWGGDVMSPQGFMAMHEFAVNSFPFVGVYRPSGNSSFNRMVSNEGLLTKEQLVDVIQRAINSARPALESMRAEQIAMEHDRTIREEQNRRYMEALERDKERERQKQEEEERKQLEEAQKQSRIDAKRNEVEKAHQRVVEHPEPDKSEGSTISLRFTLPNGSRLGRRFRQHERLQLMRDYSLAILNQCGVLAGDVEFSNNFPKRKWTREDPGWDVTIAEAEVPSQAALFVEPLEVEDDEEEASGPASGGGGSAATGSGHSLQS